MTDKQIRSFLILADTLNFHIAASQLFLTQQAVSQQISALEDELGFRLFIRNTRHVQLTSAGILFRREFSQLQRRAEDCIAQIRALDQPLGTYFRIGFLRQYPRSRLVVPLTTTLKNAFPELQFQIQLLDFSDLRRDLEEGKLDLCITSSSDWENWPHTHVQILAENPFCILYSDYLGLPEPFHFESLQKVPLLQLQEPFLGNNSKPDESLTPYSYIIPCKNLETLLLCTEAGQGYSLTPHCFEGEDAPGLHFIPLTSPQAASQIICAAHETNAHPLLRPIILQIQSYFQNCFSTY